MISREKALEILHEFTKSESLRSTRWLSKLCGSLWT